jgi:hypothetical protein
MTVALGAFVVGLVAVFVVLPAASTALGARRRGASWPVAVVAAAFFPVTWAAWYVRDYQTSPSRQSQAIGASRSRSLPPST